MATGGDPFAQFLSQQTQGSDPFAEFLSRPPASKQNAAGLPEANAAVQSATDNARQFVQQATQPQARSLPAVDPLSGMTIPGVPQPDFAGAVQRVPTDLEKLKRVVMGTDQNPTWLRQATDTSGRRQVSAGSVPLLDTDYLFDSGDAPKSKAEQAIKGALSGGASVANGSTTPENAAILAATGGLGAAGRAGVVLGKLASAGFSADMLHGAYEQIPAFKDAVDRGDIESATKIGTQMLVSGGLGAMAGRHAVEGVPAAVDAKLDGHNAEAARLVKQDAGEATPFLPPAEGKLDEKALETMLRIEPDGDKRAALANEAKKRNIPVPERGDPFAAFLNGEPTEQDQYRDLFDQADRRMATKEQRAARQPVEVPEEGVPENVSRVVDARERLAQSLTGKSWSDVSNSEAGTIDDLVKQGFGQSVQPGEKRESDGAIESRDQTRSPDVKTPSQPETPPKVVYGKPTVIRIPGEDTAYPARYAVRESDDVQTSHDPITFQPNPEYPHQNERDYSTPENAARTVEYSMPGKFKPDYTLAESPTAENGATITDQGANALGGNNRANVIARAYEHPELGPMYRAALEGKARQFGIEPNDLSQFRKPMLTRELTGEADPQKAIADFNKGAPAALMPEERAVADGKRLSPDTLKTVSGMIEDHGEGGTLSEALRGDNGAEVAQRLVDDGVITDQEKNGLVDQSGSLTPEGKSRIGKALTGRLFDSAKEYAAAGPELRAKLERIAPQVFRVERPEWALGDHVRDAVSLVNEAKARGVAVEDLAKQPDLNGQMRDVAPDTVAIASKLQEGPVKAAQAFRQYANDEALSRPGAQESFFDPPSRQDAFEAAFGEPSAEGKTGGTHAEQWPPPGSEQSRFKVPENPPPQIDPESVPQLQRFVESQSGRGPGKIAEIPVSELKHLYTPGYEHDAGRLAAVVRRGHAAAEPIIVDRYPGGIYRLRDGNHRLRAAMDHGWPTLKVEVQREFDREPAAWKRTAPEGRVTPESHAEELPSSGGDATFPEPVTDRYAMQPRAALEWVRRNKGVALDAIPHEELGSIGLKYGAPGDPAKEFKDGYGVSHIDARRPEGKDYLNQHIERIPGMRVVRRYKYPDGRPNAAVLSDGEHTALVSQNWHGKSSPNWLLTEYRNEAKEVPAPGVHFSAPEAREGGESSTPPTGSSSVEEGHGMFPPTPAKRGRAGTSPAPQRPTAQRQAPAKVSPLKQHMVEAADAVRSAADDIQKVFMASTRGYNARQAALLMRNNLAEFARRYDQAEASLRSAKKLFDRMSDRENQDFIDRIETGKAQPNQQLQTIADTLRKILDERRMDVQGLGTGKLQKFYKDYFPHVWKRPNNAKNVIASIMGRRPLEGSKAFLKQRTHMTYADGIAAGLEPVSRNPVDQVLLKAREMDRYLLGHETLNNFKAKGLAQFVDARSGKAMAGWVKIADPIGTVYGDSKLPISEYQNEGLHRGLSDFAQSIGIQHDRLMQLSKRGALGLSMTGQGQIETKFGTDPQTLAHEIGHQLDDQYGLSSILSRGATMQRELRDLADLRYEGQQVTAGHQAYVRSMPEKMAAVVQAYVAAPERMQQVAPKVKAAFEAFLKSDPKLAALTQVKPNLKHLELQDHLDAGGLVVRGHYWAPEQAARILNNYLEPGLRAKSGIYRAAVGLNNSLSQAQLGMSAFHLGFTSMDAAASKAAYGFHALLRGQPLEGLKALASTPAAPFTTLMQGDKVLKEWYKPGSQGGPIGKIVDGLVSAGGRARMDQFYETRNAEKMAASFRQGKALSGLLRVPGAAVETAAKPIMEYLVPRQKLGVFADMARFEMERLGPNAPFEQTQEALTRVWHSVENRMGQMTYDNLFWDRTAKDIAMLSVRSVGWNLGTVREIGGGLLDTVRVPAQLATGTPYRDVNLHRLSYLMGLTTTSAVAGALYQYLATGKGPEELKDYFFPKNGRMDENGRPQRVALPTYVKDVYHYGTDPGGTLAGKVAPIWSAMAEMVRNKDFYGNQIRNEDDPLVRQMLDVGAHAAKQAEPFAFRNLERANQADAPIGQKAQQFFGVTPAPAAINKTRAELLAARLTQDNMPAEGRTQEQAAKRDAEQGIARLARAGKPAGSAIASATKAGLLTEADIRRTLADAHLAPLARQVHRMGLRDALQVWEAATPEERKELKPLLIRKGDGLARLPAAERAGLMPEWRKVLGE